MNLTRAEAAMLRRRAQAPGVSGLLPGGGWRLYVPGTLTNPLNASAWTWHKRRRWAATWRDKVAQALLEAGYRRGGAGDPAAPKRVRLHAHVARRFDPDNLRACLKPVLDGLVASGVLHDDSARSGHQVAYEQTPDRQWRGVEILITRLRSSE